MNPQYANPPIREAVCEFLFQASPSWDMAVPGLVYSKLVGQFPKRLPSQGADVTTTIEMGPEGAHQQVQQMEEVRFWREDELGAIVIRPNRLSVSHYQPYPSWGEFRLIIEQALKAYRDIADPNGIERIGLRYINEFIFAPLSGNPTLEQFFDFYPHLGDEMLPDPLSFIVGVRYAFEGGRDVLRLQMTPETGGQSGSLRILLDLDYFLADPGTLQFDNVLDWIDQAHERIRTSFEGCLTTLTREQLQGVDA